MQTKNKAIIDGDEPRTITLSGREAWALGELIRAGLNGVTSLSNPAPRWSSYVHKLRGRGVLIDTCMERHGGPYAGNHARYILRSPVRLVGAD